MSGWYYIKPGRFLVDKTIGPIEDSQFLTLAHQGRLKVDTRVSHEKHTSGQWVALVQIPAAKNCLTKGAEERMQGNLAARQQRAVEREARRQRAQEILSSIMRISVKHGQRE